MNVSFTRARSKLVIFGSRKTLYPAPLLAEFIDLMEGQGWILPLPPCADEMHVLPFAKVASAGPKRAARDMDAPGKENSTQQGYKRAKKPRAQEGLLRGRPLLQDVVNGER
jgi:DNA replication ATP-dependent helicase Dna2